MADEGEGRREMFPAVLLVCCSAALPLPVLLLLLLLLSSLLLRLRRQSVGRRRGRLQGCRRRSVERAGASKRRRM
ncbi:MAG: hypothetical protein INR71_10540 [Terriglobus roseus]|nr:hypothetical protein [Terriglobus roseus]